MSTDKKKIPLCKDCKWCSFPVSNFSNCLNPFLSEIDSVTGKRKFGYASSNRIGSFDGCGYAGKFFCKKVALDPFVKKLTHLFFVSILCLAIGLIVCSVHLFLVARDVHNLKKYLQSKPPAQEQTPTPTYAPISQSSLPLQLISQQTGKGSGFVGTFFPQSRLERRHFPYGQGREMPCVNHTCHRFDVFLCNTFLPVMDPYRPEFIVCFIESQITMSESRETVAA